MNEDDILILEYDTLLYEHIAEAMATGRQVRIYPMGKGRMKIAIGGDMWSLPVLAQ